MDIQHYLRRHSPINGVERDLLVELVAAQLIYNLVWFTQKEEKIIPIPHFGKTTHIISYMDAFHRTISNILLKKYCTKEYQCLDISQEHVMRSEYCRDGW